MRKHQRHPTGPLVTIREDDNGDNVFDVAPWAHAHAATHDLIVWVDSAAVIRGQEQQNRPAPQQQTTQEPWSTPGPSTSTDAWATADTTTPF